MFEMKHEKTKGLVCLLIVATLFTTLKAEDLPPPIPPVVKCDQDIIISYGMDGFPTPRAMELDMCPTVEKSCCQKKDQLTIYSNWAHGREEKNLHERFRYHYDVYSHLLNSLIKVFPVANMILDKLKNKKVSNCKVLARKILHFKIKDIAPKLKEAIRTMHEFFFDSYKGMYCMLCDANSHQYFKLKRREIVYSERFCRDITANSLHVMLYFHIHFVKFLNLVGTFLSTCDNRGRFNEKAALSPIYVFHVKGKARNEIEKCKTFRNDPNWFKFCVELCENFKLTKFSPFFQPHLKKYRMYAEFLDKRIRHIKLLEKNDPLNQSMPGINRILAASSVDKTKMYNSLKRKEHLRVLTAKAAAKKKDTKKKKKRKPTIIEKLKMDEKKWKRLGIFRSALNAIIPIDLFKSKFKDPGLELYEYGRASLIDSARYKAVKSDLIKKAGKKIKRRPQGAGKLGKKNAFLTGIFAMFVTLFVFLR